MNRSDTTQAPAVEDIDTPTAADRVEEAPASSLVDDLVVDDLLVEDVSIDGMCGVY